MGTPEIILIGITLAVLATVAYVIIAVVKQFKK